MQNQDDLSFELANIIPLPEDVSKYIIRWYLEPPHNTDMYAYEYGRLGLGYKLNNFIYGQLSFFQFFTGCIEEGYINLVKEILGNFKNQDIHDLYLNLNNIELCLEKTCETTFWNNSIKKQSINKVKMFELFLDYAQYWITMYKNIKKKKRSELLKKLAGKTSHMVGTKGNLDCCIILYNRPVPPYFWSNPGFGQGLLAFKNCLEPVCEYGHIEMFKFLLEVHPDLDVDIALNHAIQGQTTSTENLDGKRDIAKLLLENYTTLDNLHRLISTNCVNGGVMHSRTQKLLINRYLSIGGKRICRCGRKVEQHTEVF